MTNLSLSRIIHFYLYVFALTLDFPSASIKCSTYVTSPTTNQIPETTHTKGREAERQLGFRADTSWEARLSMSSDRRSWAFQQHDKLVQVYKRQACLYEKKTLASPHVLGKYPLKPRDRWTEDNNCGNGHQPFIVDETNTSIFLKLIYWISCTSPKTHPFSMTNVNILFQMSPFYTSGQCINTLTHQLSLRGKLQLEIWPILH